MEEAAPKKDAVISWPIDPVTQQSLRRWLGHEVDENTRYIVWRLLDYQTSQTTGNIVGGDFELPFNATIVNVYAYADTAGTTGTFTVDINKNGTTILSTRITVDSTEKTSRTAATLAVISVSSVSIGDIITVDIDTVQTTPAKGLTVVLVITT